jgi:glyoxylase-like metal-dependent hydrolase (beta-lactamase superfamily II)
MAELVPLAPGVFAWLQDSGSLARPNAGVIVEDDGITLVDTLLVPSQTSELVGALEELGKPVRRVVLTSSHVSFVGGTGQLRLAAVYGTRRISADLDLPPNIAGYQRLFPECASEFEGLTTRPVSHVVT